MSKTIWKFDLNITDVQTIEMPEFAEILSVQSQNGEPRLWALVEADNKRVIRTFETYGTGHPIKEVSPRKRNYIGTYQLGAGQLVFHLFELL